MTKLGFGLRDLGVDPEPGVFAEILLAIYFFLTLSLV